MPKLSVHTEVIQARGLGAQCLLRVFKALCYLQETQGMGNMLKDTIESCGEYNRTSDLVSSTSDLQ